MSREAPVDHALHPLLTGRHSPRAFAEQPVPPEVLRSLLEAARWSASCANEQPWRWVVAPRSHAADFDALVGCLAEGNRRWAARAAVLMLSVAETRFASGAPNAHAWHDVGMATAQILVEGTARGVVGHVMAGFDREAARVAFALPEGHEPVAMIALGYPGQPTDLPEDLAQRETLPRIRRGQESFVFQGRFGQPLHLAGEAPWAPLLGFWFGPLDADGFAAPAKAQGWYGKSAAFDAALRTRFGALHTALLAGEHAGWCTDVYGRLATVVALDQLTRNLYRDSAAMYQADERALALALEAIDAGEDQHLALAERAFLYMPLMHAEDVALQDRCVALFEARQATAPAQLRDRLGNEVKYARLHRDIVARFGRFPHRNALLGRTSTPEEAAFLLEPNSSF